MDTCTPKGLPARLIERREWLVLHNRPGEGVLLKEAADCIEALEQENAKLREALESACSCSRKHAGWCPLCDVLNTIDQLEGE